MKPALSVIFFTVSSGAGFGLIALLLLVELLNFGGGIGSKQMIAGQLLALVLITAGLLSSTLHLANPKNAWRAFSRFKTSWLSREGVFAVAFYPFALAALACTYFGVDGTVRTVVQCGTILLAWITLYCTGMIYASLRPIPQWHTPLVPLGYLILGHFSGAMLLLVVAAAGGNENATYLKMALAWIVFAAVLKAIYFVWIRKAGITTTLNTALGISRAQVKLLDAGHSHATFLTNEFGFMLARKHGVMLTIGVFVVGFALPLLILITMGSALVPALAATALALLGLGLERWLFFAEARHVVRLYHGM